MSLARSGYRWLVPRFFVTGLLRHWILRHGFFVMDLVIGVNREQSTSVLCRSVRPSNR